MVDENLGQIGNYRLLQRLGEGAAGVVFLATPIKDTSFAKTGDLLAVKQYKERVLQDPNQRERIKNREFRTGTTIRHPNVVKIYEHGEDTSGKPFLVMEYIDGQPLSAWV